MAETLPTRIQLELVAPARPVVRGAVLEVSLPGKTGYLGVLPGHAPLLTELKPGELAYTEENGTAHYVAVNWGFAEVLPNRVIVLVQTSERAEEIDVERARQSKQRAEDRLKGSAAEVDLQRAQAALERAMARIEVAEKARGPSAVG